MYHPPPATSQVELLPVCLCNTLCDASCNAPCITSSLASTSQVELLPVCRDDVVWLPRATSAQLGHISELALCSKVSNVVHMLDPKTLQARPRPDLGPTPSPKLGPTPSPKTLQARPRPHTQPRARPTPSPNPTPHPAPLTPQAATLQPVVFWKTPFIPALSRSQAAAPRAPATRPHHAPTPRALATCVLVVSLPPRPLTLPAHRVRRPRPRVRYPLGRALQGRQAVAPAGAEPRGLGTR